MQTGNYSLVQKKRKLFNKRLQMASGRSLVMLLSEIYQPASRIFIQNHLPRNAQSGLHLGCRNGSATFLIADQLKDGGFIHGIDESEILLQAARVKQAEKGYTNIEFRHESIPEWHANDEYDFIFARFFINQLTDDISLPNKMFSGLVENGSLLLQFIDQANFSSYPYNHAFSRSVELMETLHEKLYAHKPESDEIRELLTRCGFQDIQFNEISPFLVKGKHRSVMSLSLETVRDEILQVGLSSTDELDALHNELRDFEKRESTVIGMPGISQVCAVKPRNENKKAN